MEANVMNILGEDPVIVVDAALVVHCHFIRSVCSLEAEHFGANAPLLLVIVGSGNGSSLFDAGQTIS